MIRKPLIDQPTQSPHNSFKQKVSSIHLNSSNRFGFISVRFYRPPPQSWTDHDDDHSTTQIICTITSAVPYNRDESKAPHRCSLTKQ